MAKIKAVTLLPVLWLIISLVFLIQGWLIANIVTTSLISILGIIFTFKRKDIVKDQCYCLFGGIIIVIFFLLLSSQEFGWGHLFQTLFHTSLLSLPLILTDKDSRTRLVEFLRESKMPLPLGGGKPEDFASGCFVWIILTIIAILMGLFLGFIFTIMLYFFALQTLFENADSRDCFNVMMRFRPKSNDNTGTYVKGFGTLRVNNKNDSEKIHWL